MQPIYLDHQATTPLDPRVLDAMLPVLRDDFGNASSRFHTQGLRAGRHVEDARAKVAALLGAPEREIVFTSGATESNNMAIFGVAEAMKAKGRHIVSAATEHHAVIDPLMKLRRRGWEVTFLPVDRAGRIDLDLLRSEIRDDTVLVSLMAANNETGAIHPVAEIGAIARERGVTFHCDAVQAAGKIPIDVEAWSVDLLSVSAHKFNGPKGVGALYVRRRRPRVHLEPLIVGGGQERGLRSGTYNTPGIVGLGEAARLAREELPQRAAHMKSLRDRLWSALSNNIPEIALNGPAIAGDEGAGKEAAPSERLPNNLNIAFRCCEAQSILMELSDRVALSPGSACTGDNTEPSFVLLAMGLSREEAISSLRFGIGRETTEEEIDRVAAMMAGAVAKLRAMSRVWKTEYADRSETSPR